MDRTLSGATTPSQSRPGGDGNEEVLRIPQSSCIIGTSPSDCLVSYLGHLLWKSYTLQKCSRRILQPQLTAESFRGLWENMSGTMRSFLRIYSVIALYLLSLIINFWRLKTGIIKGFYVHCGYNRLAVGQQYRSNFLLIQTEARHSSFIFALFLSAGVSVSESYRLSPHFHLQAQCSPESKTTCVGVYYS